MQATDVVLHNNLTLNFPLMCGNRYSEYYATGIQSSALMSQLKARCSMQKVFPLIKTGFLLSILMNMVFLPGVSLADRHCLPALEAYQGARYALRDYSLSCASALDQAAAGLHTALDRANACACRDLADALERLINQVAKGEDCPAMASEILGQSDRIRAFVDACNH